MRWVFTLFSLLIFSSTACAAGSSVLYEIDNQQYEGYFVLPAPNSPLVLLIHDWDGLTDYEKKRADMLAEMGYAVFAADLFGKGVFPESQEERRRLTEALKKDRTRMRTLLQGALSKARDQTGIAQKAVAAGYCFGGGAVLELARSGADLKGFVIFHGDLATPAGQDYFRTKGELLVLHGTADTSVTMGDFAALAKELEKAEIPHEMITYGGAPHAFTVFGGDRYSKDADEKSWKRFGEFLAEVLK